MVNLLDFTGKQILLTGATSGIGKETAILLSNLGAKMILFDIDELNLKETTSHLSGSGHHFFNFDLSDLNCIEPKIKEVVTTLGRFDGFVHCAGIRCRRPLSMITPKVLNKIISLNFGSFIELVRCITKKNSFNDGLSIVGISSVSSQKGGSSVTAYAASKAAMDCAVRCLAKELAPKKIRLNTVVPAQINTPAYINFLEMNGGPEAATLSRQYLGLGEPVDVACIIAFLLNSCSKFITGSSIPVDGGFLSS